MVGVSSKMGYNIVVIKLALDNSLVGYVAEGANYFAEDRLALAILLTL